MQKLLTQIQSRLKAPKSQYNKFGGYNYRNCEDILEALKPILTELDAAIKLDDEIIMIGERVYIKATATLIKDDKTISASAFAREPDSRKGMDEAQVTGSSSSYARKYALNGLFAIDDTRDPDYTNNGNNGQLEAKKEHNSKTQSNQNLLSDAKIKRLYDLAMEHGADIDGIKKYCYSHFNKNNLKLLSEKEYNLIISMIEKKGSK